MSTETTKIKPLIPIPPINPNNYTKLQPNRFDKYRLYYEHDISTSTTTCTSSGTHKNEDNYRYELTILDQNMLPSQIMNKIQHPIAVFLIPAGRENEYLFRSTRGLLSIAQSAKCARLISVSFSRNHVYQDQKSVQAELEYVVQILGQRGVFLKKRIGQKEEEFSIPFMALDGMGERNVLAKGDTKTTGPYIVEEVKMNDDETVRRLYFTNNPFVIQTEVILKQQEEKRGGGEKINEENEITNVLVVDKWRLAFEYHRHLVAGYAILSLLGDSNNNVGNDAISTKQRRKNILVIGLGGGGLPNFFSQFVPNANITVVELDQCVVEIAKRYFDFKEGVNVNGTSTAVKIGDGSLVRAAANAADIGEGDAADGSNEAVLTQKLERTLIGDTNNEKGGSSKINKTIEENKTNSEFIEFPPSSMSLIVIDVDSKDATVGMSCPPTSFISIPYLTRLRHLLCTDDNDHNNHSMLAINVSARDPTMLDLVKKNVSSVFPFVYLSAHDNEQDDDEEADSLNVIVFAKTHDMVLPEKGVLVDELRQLCHDNSQDREEIISELEECAVGIARLDASRKNFVCSDQKIVSGGGGKKKKGSGGKKKKGKKR